MKCKYCNGTGEHINDANRMTTCEFCGGTGEVEVVGDSVTDVYDKCGGTGFFCEMRMGDRCTLGSPMSTSETDDQRRMVEAMHNGTVGRLVAWCLLALSRN